MLPAAMTLSGGPLALPYSLHSRVAGQRNVHRDLQGAAPPIQYGHIQAVYNTYQPFPFIHVAHGCDPYTQLIPMGRSVPPTCPIDRFLSLSVAIAKADPMPQPHVAHGSDIYTMDVIAIPSMSCCRQVDPTCLPARCWKRGCPNSHFQASSPTPNLAGSHLMSVLP